MRFAILVGLLSFGLATQSVSQAQLLVPEPEVSQPAKPAQVRPRATTPSKPRAASVPLTECEEVTKPWVDNRPVQDFPSLEGLATIESLQSAMVICEEEQRRQPGNTRITFIFARTLEVNGKGTRAIKLYEQLASAGYVPATTQLARAYFIGNSVRRNVVEACNRYVGSARAGDIWAFSPAAECVYLYTNPPDLRRACQFYRQAKSRDTLEPSARPEDEYCQ